QSPAAESLDSTDGRKRLWRPTAGVRRVPRQTRRPPEAAKSGAGEIAMQRDRAQTAGDADSCQNLRFGNVARGAPGPECFDNEHTERADNEPAPDFLAAFQLGIALLTNPLELLRTRQRGSCLDAQLIELLELQRRGVAFDCVEV